mgnify:CR=1 FL=1
MWMFREKLMNVEFNKKFKPRTPSPSIGIEDIIVTDYVGGMSRDEIRKKYKISDRMVVRLVRESGNSLRTATESRRISSGLTIDCTAFNNFSEPLAQYFYGLILADGSLRGNSINFCIKNTDAKILEQFQKYLGMNYGLKFSSAFDNRTLKTYHRCTFAVSEKKIVDRLKEQGLLQAKSCKETLPKFDWLNSRDFWRGVIDGDGHIRLQETRALALVGSEEVVNGFIAFCNNFNLLQTPRKASSKFYKNLELFKVQLTADDAERVARFIYREGDTALERKLVTVLNYPSKLKHLTGNQE